MDRKDPSRWTVARHAARVIVWLRFLLVPGWIALALVAANELPSIFDANASSIGNLVSQSSPPVKTELQADRTFGLPLLTRTMVVGAQPGGFSRSQVAGATRYISRIDKAAGPGDVLRGAVPLAHVRGLASPTSA